MINSYNLREVNPFILFIGTERKALTLSLYLFTVKKTLFQHNIKSHHTPHKKKSHHTIISTLYVQCHNCQHNQCNSSALIIPKTETSKELHPCITYYTYIPFQLTLNVTGAASTLPTSSPFTCRL